MNSLRILIEKAKVFRDKILPHSQPNEIPTPIVQTNAPVKTEEPPKVIEETPKEVNWVGPYTQHLRRRRNNVLFPEIRRSITAQEWQDAALYDAPRIKAHKDKLASLMAARLIGTGRFSSESIKDKTGNEVFLHFYENLKQFDALILEYVFLQGTSTEESDDINGPKEWDPQTDTFFSEVLVGMRNELEESMRKATLQCFNDDAIRAFSQSRENTHKTSFETSHFHQVYVQNSVFLNDGDFYPRLFSESDKTLDGYIQFCIQAENKDAMLIELKKNFLLCFERSRGFMNGLPLAEDEPHSDQVVRYFHNMSGLLKKGQTLGLLNEDASYAIPYEELTKIIQS